MTTFSYLVIAYDNYTSKKIHHYELLVLKQTEIETRMINGKRLELPQHKTIYRGKITKTAAKELMAEGVVVSAGYSMSGK